MNVEKNLIFDEEEAIEFIRLNLLQEYGLELDKYIIDKVLRGEEDYLIAKGIAIPIEDDDTYV